MKISAKSAAAFGVTSGVGGLMLGTLMLNDANSYAAPVLFGGVVGWGVNLSGGSDYSPFFAIATGAASALVARVIAGLIIDQQELKTEASALSATRKGLLGALAGTALVGMIAPQFSPALTGAA